MIIRRPKRNFGNDAFSKFIIFLLLVACIVVVILWLHGLTISRGPLYSERRPSIVFGGSTIFPRWYVRPRMVCDNHSALWHDSDRNSVLVTLSDSLGRTFEMNGSTPSVATLRKSQQNVLLSDIDNSIIIVDEKGNVLKTNVNYTAAVSRLIDCFGGAGKISKTSIIECCGNFLDEREARLIAEFLSDPERSESK